MRRRVVQIVADSGRVVFYRRDADWRDTSHTYDNTTWASITRLGLLLTKAAREGRATLALTPRGWYCVTS
jgi:hypothetical protein